MSIPKAAKKSTKPNKSRGSAGKSTAAKNKLKPIKVAFKPVRIFGLVLWPRFLRNAWHELTLVTWPGWKLSRQLTVAVIIFAVVFAVLVGLVDWGFDKAFKELFLR